MLFVYLLIHVMVFVSLTATVHVHVNAVKVYVQYNVHVVCCLYEPLFCVHTKLTLVQTLS